MTSKKVQHKCVTIFKNINGKKEVVGHYSITYWKGDKNGY